MGSHIKLGTDDAVAIGHISHRGYVGYICQQKPRLSSSSSTPAFFGWIHLGKSATGASAAPSSVGAAGGSIRREALRVGAVSGLVSGLSTMD